jgi:hypothetical protein
MSNTICKVCGRSRPWRSTAYRRVERDVLELEVVGQFERLETVIYDEAEDECDRELETIAAFIDFGEEGIGDEDAASGSGDNMEEDA